MAVLKRRKSAKPPGRRWVKRRDYVFFYFFGFLVVASLLVSHLPRSSQSTSFTQAPVLSRSLPTSSSTGSSSGSARQGGRGSLTPGQDVSPNQQPASNAQENTGQTTPAQPGGSQDLGDGWLIGNNGLLAWTDPNLTFANQQVGIAWSGMLLMADLFLVLFIMLNGIRVAMGGAGFRYADALESLPRIALAFAAAHLSWYFIACLIGINNGMCATILSFAQKNNLGNAGGLTLTDVIGQAFALLLELVGWIIGSLIPGIGQVIQGVALTAFIGSCIEIILDITLFVLYALLMVQLLVRIALVNLLYILAPLGLASWALPQGAGQQLTRVWLNATFAAIMVQFLQLCAYTLGLLLFNPISGLTKVTVGALGFNVVDLGIIFKMPLVWFTLRIPGLVQNVATNTMSEGSRNISATISQALGSAQSAVSTVIIAGFR